MEALEPVGNIDFVKKLSQMSGRSELAKQNMARGEKALCLVHTLKQDYDLSQEQLTRYSGELAEIEAANEQCMDCNGKDCAHKPEWRQLMVQADCTGGQYSMRVCPCRIQRDKLRQQRLEKLMVTAHVPVNYRQDTWKDFSLQPGNKRGLMLATMAAKENISLYLHGDHAFNKIGKMLDFGRFGNYSEDGVEGGHIAGNHRLPIRQCIADHRNIKLFAVGAEGAFGYSG